MTITRTVQGDITTIVIDASKKPTQEVQDTQKNGFQHRLVSHDGQRKSNWAGYASIAVLDGWVGFTAYWSVKEGVCDAFTFCEQHLA